jgi:hypothetical protein
MGTGALRPEQFAEHVAAFRDRHHEEGYHDEDRALGQCYDASEKFHTQLSGAKVGNHEIREYHRESDPYSWSDVHEPEFENHHVNVVNLGGKKHVVDWTGRQFGEKNYETGQRRTQPEVMPEGQWRKTYGWKRGPIGDG